MIRVENAIEEIKEMFKDDIETIKNSQKINNDDYFKLIKKIAKNYFESRLNFQDISLFQRTITKLFIREFHSITIEVEVNYLSKLRISNDTPYNWIGEQNVFRLYETKVINGFLFKRDLGYVVCDVFYKMEDTLTKSDIELKYIEETDISLK